MGVRGAADPLEAVDIDRRSTVDQVVAALQAAILDGRLAPGTPLREAALAVRFRVSRGTVREALRTLAAEGLVSRHPHRGAEVVRLEEEDALDIYAARRVVEVAAAERGVRAGTEARAGLRAALARMEETAASADVSGFVEAHATFHAELVGMLGSRRLRRFAEALQGELRLSFAMLERLTGTLEASVAGHREVLSAIESGDTQAARRAVLVHLQHGADEVAELPEGG